MSLASNQALHAVINLSVSFLSPLNALGCVNFEVESFSSDMIGGVVSGSSSGSSEGGS